MHFWDFSPFFPFPPCFISGFLPQQQPFPLLRAKVPVDGFETQGWPWPHNAFDWVGRASPVKTAFFLRWLRRPFFLVGSDAFLRPFPYYKLPFLCHLGEVARVPFFPKVFPALRREILMLLNSLGDPRELAWPCIILVRVFPQNSWNWSLVHFLTPSKYLFDFANPLNRRSLGMLFPI